MQYCSVWCNPVLVWWLGNEVYKNKVNAKCKQLDADQSYDYDYKYASYAQFAFHMVIVAITGNY